RLCGELFLTSTARERDDNLLFVRDRIVRNEEELAGLLDLYGQIRSGRPVRGEGTNRLVSLVRLSGLVRVAESHSLAPSRPRSLPPSRLTVRNRIYERVFDRAWIAEHMPDAEVRRQKAAYRRGLVRAASVAMVVVAVMAGLVVTAVSQAHRAEAASAR